jgi:hypothetical protein
LASNNAGLNVLDNAPLAVYQVAPSWVLASNNAGLNVLDNAPLAVYQVALVGYWLVMGFKTDSSPVDAWLSKMEAAIENIVSLATATNIVFNQLMECEAAVVVTIKVASAEEPKWTIVMAKNVR